LRLVNFARNAGLRSELGTLVGETGILSSAAEIFGRRVEGFEFLEGKGQSRKLLTGDIVERTSHLNGTCHWGLGVRLNTDLARISVSPPLFFE
jgi:hypothetical protein